MFLSLYKGFLAIIEIANLLFLLATTLLSPIVRAIKSNVPLKSVTNKTVLITGAGHGIGRELSIRFAQNDAITVLFDINEVSTWNIHWK